VDNDLVSMIPVEMIPFAELLCRLDVCLEFIEGI
jgi:hypothetical protein